MERHNIEMKSELKESTNSNCQYCNAEFLQLNDLEVHIQEQHPFQKNSRKCIPCNKIFKNMTGYKLHLKNHNTVHHLCKYCGRRYSSQITLKNHMKKEHSTVNLECPVCKKICATTNLYEYHLKTHNEDKRFKCQYCPKQFLQPHHLRHHERIHTGERPHLCTICGLAFKLKINLNEHYAKKHNEIIKIVNPKFSKSAIFECTECEKTFVNRTMLKQHVVIHSKDKKYTCSICGESFNVERYLKRHLKIVHADAQKCHLCPKEFIYDLTLKKHLCTDHNIISTDTFPCKLCSKVFFLPSSLNTHMKIHDEDRTLKCPQCDNCYRTEKTLQAHLNIIHLDNKPHACDVRKIEYCYLNETIKIMLLFQICPRRFFYPGQLREHMTLHTGERPYSCEYCNSTFRAKLQLKEHIYKQHTHEKTKECKFCGEAFFDNPQLRTHLNKIHKHAMLDN